MTKEDFKKLNSTEIDAELTKKYKELDNSITNLKIENAKEKINKKGCDYLIANDISRKDIGFSSDFNEVTILDKNGGMKKLERASKKTIAKEIFNYIKF